MHPYLFLSLPDRSLLKVRINPIILIGREEHGRWDGSLCGNDSDRDRDINVYSNTVIDQPYLLNSISASIYRGIQAAAAEILSKHTGRDGEDAKPHAGIRIPGPCTDPAKSSPLESRVISGTQCGRGDWSNWTLEATPVALKISTVNTVAHIPAGHRCSPPGASWQ
ncbi:hypothetical protein P167DRAFT_541463 [Morchella conica CCBAS932]|uniref:Uncharacterized protein n=1 Tax=Morchella conica CCBAS932 TaxID=1392247 RepID=A0A3N4L7G4_9PEZI|nr:hypothetical protein P167DRAFT_541463 [Morchella conica CCBAS932]